MKTKIGGQAVLEGVMMRGERSMALSIRDETGNIHTETTRLSDKKPWYRRVPFLRGVINLVISMVDGFKIIGKSADFMVDDVDIDGKGNGAIMGLSMLLGIVFALALFVGLPTAVSAGIFALFKIDASTHVWLKSLIEGVAKMIVLVVYMASISAMKEIKRVFMYHGAEHKTISCYENELPLTVENVQKCSRYHDRCGTSFIVFVVVLSIVLMMVLDVVCAACGFTAFLDTKNWWLRMLLKIALLPLTAGVSYEVLMGLAKTNFVLFRPLKWLGKQFQKLTTREPDDGMCEVAIASFEAVLAMDADPDLPERRFQQPLTSEQFKQLVSDGLVPLTGVKDVEWLTAATLKIDRKDLDKPDLKIPFAWTYRLTHDIERIRSGEPWQYVLEREQFGGLDYYVDNDVLIPRPETELVVEQALRFVDDGHKVLDLCCGSGIVGVTIATRKKVDVTFADVSEKAIRIAKFNAKNNNVKAKFVVTNMFEKLGDEQYDVIVCNPPYIETATIDTLDSSVKDYEPHLALDGGADGLDFYRTLAAEAHKHLADHGVLVMEIGYNQGETVPDLFENRYNTDVLKDYSHNDRIVICILVNKI